MKRKIITRNLSRKNLEVQQLWKTLQNKERELKNKSRKTAQEKEYLTELTAFLNNHQLNSETGYLEGK